MRRSRLLRPLPLLLLATAWALLLLLPQAQAGSFSVGGKAAVRTTIPPRLLSEPGEREGQGKGEETAPREHSFLEEVLRRLRGDFMQPLSDRTRLAIHYDFRDFQFGLRGLGLRHVSEVDFRASTSDADEKEEDDDSDVSKGPALVLGRRLPFLRTVALPGQVAVAATAQRMSPFEIRSGASVKRIRGVAIPQFWRMGRIDRVLWGGLQVIAHGVGTTVGATFDGAAQLMKFELSHATALPESGGGLFDGVPIRLTLSPILSKRPLRLSAAVPRWASFSPSVDLLSLGLGCEWAEPVVWQEEGFYDHDGDGGMSKRPRQRRLEAGGAAIRVAIAARSLQPGGTLRVSWVDSRFFDGKGLTTATLHVPISSDFADNPFRQASLSLEHTWQLPWPRWLDSAGDRLEERRKRRRQQQQRTGSFLDDDAP